MSNTIIDNFATLEDPRVDRTKQYPLIEVIFLTISAVISGADHFTEIVMFGDEQIDWLRKFLPFKNGIPSHDTIGRLFSLIEPDKFKARFAAWIQSVAKITNNEKLPKFKYNSYHIQPMTDSTHDRLIQKAPRVANFNTGKIQKKSSLTLSLIFNNTYNKRT